MTDLQPGRCVHLAGRALMGPCLYCKSEAGSFTSVEHIFPESMGNHELVLPKGTVCDECNNGVLARLDTVLLDFEPIALMRTVLGIPNKAGAVPAASFANMRFVRKGPNHIAVYIQGRRGFNPNASGFDLDFRGRKYADSRCRLLARALYKVGLGVVHLDRGPAVSLSARFDEVREIILGHRGDFHGYLAFGKATKPKGRVAIEHLAIPIGGEELSLFTIDFFGVVTHFDLERRRLDNPGYLERLGLFNILTF